MTEIEDRISEIQVKELVELSDQERCAWSTLLQDEAEVRRAFLSYEFASTVNQCGAEVLVVIGFQESKPIWFMPLQRHPGWLGRFGIFEPVGGVMSDYFGAIGQPGVAVSPAKILSASSGKIAAILFTHLDETQASRGLTGSEPRLGLRTRIGNSPAVYWEDLRRRDKKLVYDTERREKKLNKDHGSLSFEWQSENVQSDLKTLVEMKNSQYSRTGKLGAPLFEERNVKLLETLSLSHRPDCTGVLSVLRCGHELVAAHLGLRCHEVLHIWFPVYATKYASYSPGRILMKYIIHNAADHGVEVLDRGEGDTQAKRDFANEEHRYFRGMWSAGSLRGLFARLAMAIYWRL